MALIISTFFINRCDEMERKLRFLEKEIKKDDIPMMDSGDSPEAPQPREMIDLEATFEKLEHELQEVNQNAEALKKNFLELTELKHILRKTQQFFEEQDQLEGIILFHKIKSRFEKAEVKNIAIHQDLATAGKRAVRPPVARFGGSEAILRKSIM